MYLYIPLFYFPIGRLVICQFDYYSRFNIEDILSPIVYLLLIVGNITLVGK
jgi:hypothetical protein